jgi:hypothetical protein
VLDIGKIFHVLKFLVEDFQIEQKLEEFDKAELKKGQVKKTCMIESVSNPRSTK